jgi:hypothetical protein
MPSLAVGCHVADDERGIPSKLDQPEDGGVAVPTDAGCWLRACRPDRDETSCITAWAGKGVEDATSGFKFINRPKVVLEAFLESAGLDWAAEEGRGAIASTTEEDGKEGGTEGTASIRKRLHKRQK